MYLSSVSVMAFFSSVFTGASRGSQYMKSLGRRGGHRGTGFAGPLVAPPEGEAPQALRGGVHLMP
jgi:hypothetical protein